MKSNQNPNETHTSEGYKNPRNFILPDSRYIVKIKIFFKKPQKPMFYAYFQFSVYQIRYHYHSMILPTSHAHNTLLFSGYPLISQRFHNLI